MPASAYRSIVTSRKGVVHMINLKGSIYEQHPMLLLNPWCWVFDIIPATIMTMSFETAFRTGNAAAPHIMRTVLRGVDPRYD